MKTYRLAFILAIALLCAACGKVENNNNENPEPEPAVQRDLPSSLISAFASLQRGTSILVPTTSTTFAAIIEPTSPQTFRGIPREWA